MSRPVRSVTAEPRGGLCATALLIASLPVSALLVAVALGQAAHPGLAWVALLPIFAAIRRLDPLSGFCAGAMWGVSLFGWSALANLAPDVGATWTALLVLGGLPAAYVFAGVVLRRAIGYSPFVLAVGWIFVELGLQPLGLRHGLLAAAQGSDLLLHKLGELFGYVLVAFLVAYANASLVALLAWIGTRLPRPAPRPLLLGAGERLAHFADLVFIRSALGLHRARSPPLGG